MEYQLIIYLKSPVCIAKKRGTGNVLETIDYIPGSTIRGSMAMYYLERYGIWDSDKRLYILPEDKKTEFNHFFNSNAVCFNNAYPEGAKIIPLTASSCKYQRGFYNGREDYHGVRDTLIELTRYELTGGFDRDKFDYCAECECKAPMDRFSGYYEESRAAFEQVIVSKRLIVRTAVSDTFEKASSGQLYTTEVLNEGQIFIAELNKETFDKLKPIFNNAVLRIGIAKNRGLGEVEVKIWENGKDEKYPLAEKLKGLNDKINKFVPDKLFFSVTLHSDTILLDDILRFKSTIEIKDLIDSAPEITDEKAEILNKFRLLRGFLSTHIVSGWNIALKLPQEDVVAISKGSVFLFMADNLSEEDKERLINVLDNIEQSGIGECKNKGFGRIRFCDEFHWEVPLK